VLLVTSAIHMPRSLGVFRKVVRGSSLSRPRRFSVVENFRSRGIASLWRSSRRRAIW